MKVVNEKVDLIQSENKFIVKRLAQDEELRKTTENGLHKIGNLLELVLELSEADRRQNDDISELIATILATNEKISVLNQSIAVLKGGNGTLSLKSAEEIVRGHNDVNGQQTTGASSPASKGGGVRDVTSDRATSGGSCDDVSAKETTEFDESDTEAKGAKAGQKGAMDPYPAENSFVEDRHESEEATQPKDWTEGDSSSQQITDETESGPDLTDSEDHTEKTSGSNSRRGSMAEEADRCDTTKGSVSSSEIDQTLPEISVGTLQKLRRRRRGQKGADNRLVIMIEEKSQNKEQTVERKNLPAPPSFESEGISIHSSEDNTTDFRPFEEKNRLMLQSRRVLTEEWLVQASRDAERHQELKHQQGRGMDFIFILDTSASMEGEGFRQMKGVVTTILNEFERRSLLDINVAVITFGHQNKYLRYCSNRYYDIKRSLDDIQCGGPSPLGAGLLLTVGTRGAVGISNIGKWHVQPKIVLISDGIATDHHYPEGPEDTEPGSDKRLEIEDLVNLVQQIAERNSIWCVPVGNPDMPVLEMISGLTTGGKIVHLHEAKKIGRFPHNVKVAEQLHRLINTKEKMDREIFQATMSDILPDLDLTQSDWDDIYEMATSPGEEFKTMEDIIEEAEDAECQERYPNMPPIGTRVRRGPGWKWGDQDSHGPGTVTGHSKNPGWISVMWDSGAGFQYRYGADGMFDIVVCDSPRVLVDQLIAVGCLVTRGADWEWGDQDGGEGSIGVIYRVNDSAIVHVRWPNGEKSNYRFGFDGKFDVKVCDPFSPEVKRVLQQQTASAGGPSPMTEPTSASSTKNIAKKTDASKPSSDQEDTQTLEDMRRTGSSINIMDMAPPVKHTVWSDLGTSFAVNQSNRMRTSRSLSSLPETATPSQTDRGRPIQEDDLKTNRENTRKPSTENTAPTRGMMSDSSTAKEHLPDSHKDNGGGNQAQENIEEEKEQPAKSRVEGVDSSRHDGTQTITEGHRPETTPCSHIDPPALVTEKTCWQWKDPYGQWITYPPEVQEKLRKNFQKNPRSTVLINQADSLYRVVFSKNKQINTGTKDFTEIRQINA